MDLDTLFTLTEYKCTMMKIPCVFADTTTTITTGANGKWPAEAQDDASANDEIENKQDNFLEIPLSYSPAACTDYDLTGQIVWPVSVFLSHFLASRVGQEQLVRRFESATCHGKPLVVVELGAGTGLPGITAAHVLHRAVLNKHKRSNISISSKSSNGSCKNNLAVVALTDGNETVMQLLQQNAVKNQQEFLWQAETIHNDSRLENETESNGNENMQNDSPPVRIVSSPLVWGEPQQLTRLIDKVQIDSISSMVDSDYDPTNKNAASMPQVQIVLAADVVQWPVVVEPLLHTAKALLWTLTTRINAASNADTLGKESVVTVTPVFWLGIVNRAQQTYDLFFQWALELGFSCRQILPEEFLPVDPSTTDKQVLIPPSCQEYGGRQTQLWELTLTDMSVPPVLLSFMECSSDSSSASTSTTKHEHHQRDWTVGTSYENVYSLPY